MKITFNWGTGIVMAIIGFIAFILYFVVNMSTNEKFHHDLVTEEYYKKELDFGQRLDKERNAQSLKENINIEKTAEGLLVNFPKDLDPQQIKGNVFLYRPSNKQLDHEIPLSLSNHQLLVPDNRLLGGRWNIEVDWTYQGESYFFKKEIIW